MSDFIEFIKESRYNKNKRKTVILVGTAIILVLVFLIRLAACKEDPLPPEGSIRVLICPNCNEKQLVRVKDMQKETHLCSKCETKLSKCLKCGDCGFEFPYSDTEIAVSGKGSKAQKFTRLNEMRKCPQCGSINTHMLSPGVLEQRDNDKKKYRANYGQ